MTLKSKQNKILEEIAYILSQVQEDQVENLLEAIGQANNIVTLGAGRVGMSAKGFAMRLGHLGLKAYHIGDTTLPNLKAGDLLLVASGSGETQSIFYLVEIAKKKSVNIALVTGNPDSRIGKLSDTVVHIKAPSKVKVIEGFNSIQPMTTLNEQCLGIFFDALVLLLMEKMNESHDTMLARHSNLE